MPDTLREICGLRNQLFTFLAPGETGGDATVTYAERGLSWGRLLANAATGGLNAETTYTIQMNPRLDLAVDPTWQLALGARRFTLIGLPMDPDGLGMTWTMQAVEATG